MGTAAPADDVGDCDDAPPAVTAFVFFKSFFMTLFLFLSFLKGLKFPILKFFFSFLSRSKVGKGSCVLALVGRLRGMEEVPENCNKLLLIIGK